MISGADTNTLEHDYTTGISQINISSCKRCRHMLALY